MTARILIIEDHPDNMELMVCLLEAFGYAVLSALSGEAGMKTAFKELPDLIICDVHLPNIDGYGVLAYLKGEPALRSTPVIAVTALAMVGDRQKLLNAGFNGYLSKPIEPEAFVPQVEKFIPASLRASTGHRVTHGTTPTSADAPVPGVDLELRGEQKGTPQW
jgi:CheY-like chemotaxis protein